MTRDRPCAGDGRHRQRRRPSAAAVRDGPPNGPASPAPGWLGASAWPPTSCTRAAGRLWPPLCPATGPAWGRQTSHPDLISALAAQPSEPCPHSGWLPNWRDDRPEEGPRGPVPLRAAPGPQDRPRGGLAGRPRPLPGSREWAASAYTQPARGLLRRRDVDPAPRLRRRAPRGWNTDRDARAGAGRHRDRPPSTPSTAR